MPAKLTDLQPLGYHQRIVEFLESHEADLWAWFQSDKFAEQYKRDAQLRLGKSAVRLSPQSSPNNARRYELAAQARDKLGLSEPIVLYQSQDTGGSPNAMLHYIPGQITIEFAGRILELLDDVGLLDLLGHEIAHYKLYQDDGGRHHNAVRLLYWVCQRENCSFPWFETARRLSLYTEVYCDIAGYLVTGSRDAVVRGLAMIVADFKDVDAKTYLEQVEAVLAQDKSASRGISHPELYIRAKAIAERDRLGPKAVDAALVPLIEGPLDVENLDLLGQDVLSELTRALIDQFTRYEAHRTDAVLAHARTFFPKYKWPAKSSNSVFALPALAPSTRDYLAYVLLDLATCDKTHTDDGLAGALVVARTTGLSRSLQKVARKELKRTANELTKFERHGEKTLGVTGNA